MALRESMQSDKRIMLLGEDIGKNGGVFRVTDGLYSEFGESRVMDTPLSESGIIGVSIGLALYGYRPVAEIQFLDFIYPGFDQIISELSKMRYRSGGEYSAPVVIRAPYGGGIKGGPYHSQSCESFFAHTAGLKVVTPSNPYDAKGLLKACLRSEDPVIFLEPKILYRSVKQEVPATDYQVPIGLATQAKEGNDVTLITYGSMVPISMRAAQQAKDAGIDVEVIDLRTLAPFDTETILASVRKTGRAVVVHEAPRTMGFGSEICALIAEQALDSLEAPVVRVAGYDTPFPFIHEAAFMPTPTRVLSEIRKVAAY